MLQPGFEELSPPLQPPQHQMLLAASRQSRGVPAAQLTWGHLKASRRHPDIFQLIPVITLLSSPPAWLPASRAAVLCSQESLVGGREEAVSTKTTGRRRELELQQSTLKAFSMNKMLPPAPGIPLRERGGCSPLWFWHRRGSQCQVISFTSDSSTLCLCWTWLGFRGTKGEALSPIKLL